MTTGVGSMLVYLSTCLDEKHRHQHDFWRLFSGEFLISVVYLLDSFGLMNASNPFTIVTISFWILQLPLLNINKKLIEFFHIFKENFGTLSPLL